jgi:hypothetical protein
MQERKGCLDGIVLAKAQAAAAAAPWNKSHRDIRCHAAGGMSTTYKLSGKGAFTEQLCGSDTLDEKSHQQIGALEQILAEAMGSAAPAR